MFCLTSVSHRDQSFLSLKELLWPSTKSVGEDAGLKYPDVAPAKVSEVNVPKREVSDKLKYDKYDEILPRPDIHAFVQDNNLNMDTANAVIALLEDYRASVGNKFMDLYNVCSANLNASEDLL